MFIYLECYFTEEMESEINTKTLIDDNHQLNKISTGNLLCICYKLSLDIIFTMNLH